MTPTFGMMSSTLDFSTFIDQLARRESVFHNPTPLLVRVDPSHPISWIAHPDGVSFVQAQWERSEKLVRGMHGVIQGEEDQVAKIMAKGPSRTNLFSNKARWMKRDVDELGHAMTAVQEAKTGFVGKANGILVPLQAERPGLALMPEALASRQAPTSLITRELQAAERTLLEATGGLARLNQAFLLAARTVQIIPGSKWTAWIVYTKHFARLAPPLGVMLAVGFAAYNWHEGKSSQYIVTHFMADLLPGKAGLICSGALMCQDVIYT